MTGLLPFIEKLFGVLTDISLLELGDVSHPLLAGAGPPRPEHLQPLDHRGLDRRGGRRSHRRRGLLVRVGAYFHDIGKMLKPEYFVENQSTAGSRHESLVPGHEHAGDHRPHQGRRRPGPAARACPSRSSISSSSTTARRWSKYFFDLASEQSQADPNGAEVDESSFRYPGPKPQTKEAAVLMLADAVESACRSLVDPAPSRIESLVREIAERKLDDGQFDESGLTLRELRTIERSIDQVADRQLPRPREVPRSKNRLMITIDVANEQSTLPVDDGRLRRAVRMILADATVRRARISLAVVDDPAIRRLNRRFLDHDCATDVLSFNLDDSGGRFEGEVIVSADTAAAAAPRFGWRPEDELLLYVIHGALHLVGLADGTDDQRQQMRRRERECLARFGLEPHDEEPAALECGVWSPLFQGPCHRRLPAARNNASKAATSRRTSKCRRAGPEEVT